MSEKYALVTGASSGIGKACALYLDSLGYRIIAGIYPQQEDGERLKQESFENLIPIFVDVTNQQSIDQLRLNVGEIVGSAGLAALVNCAGVPGFGPVEFQPLDDLKKVFDVNFFGTYAICQAFIPLLRSGGGRIVNISSDGGLVSFPFATAYCGSKFAVEALSDALRVELKPWGISVSVIEPGNVATDIWEKTAKGVSEQRKCLPPEADEYYGKAYAKWSGMQRQGIKAEKVAQAIAHALTSSRPKTRYVVGNDAKITRLIAKLPDRWRDSISTMLISSYESS